MPVTTSPFLMNDVTVKLVASGGTLVEYRCQLSRAELVPSQAAGAGGSTYSTFCDTFDSGGGGNSSWTLELSGFQAVKDAEDLTRFLFANEGELLDYELVPAGGVIAADNTGYSGQCTAVPTPIGGTANSYATFDVSLPCQGKPTELVTPPV